MATKDDLLSVVRSHVDQNVFDLFMQMLAKYKGHKKKENREGPYGEFFMFSLAVSRR